MSGPRILAIETRCDETGIAVVTGGRQIESNVVASQVAVHASTGGIVPEVAARQQLRWIIPGLEAALGDANANWGDLDAIAVTSGPGLIGSLLVGVNVAKGLAANSLEAVSSTPEELAALLKHDTRRWGGLVKSIGFTPEA